MYKNYSENYRKGQLKNPDFLDKDNKDFYRPPPTFCQQTYVVSTKVNETLPFNIKKEVYEVLDSIYDPKFLTK